MTVKEWIDVLKTLDQEKEIYLYDNENGVFGVATINEIPKTVFHTAIYGKGNWYGTKDIGDNDFQKDIYEIM